MKTLVVAIAALAIVTGCTTPHQVTQNNTYCPPNPAIPASLNSPGGKFALLPTAVQRTITACCGTADIKDITKANAEQDDVYQIEFKDPDNPTLYVSADGTPAYTLTPFFPFMPAKFSTILPSAVQATLERQAPNTAISNIEPAQMMIYQITFTDPNSHPPLLILENGTVLDEKPAKTTSAR